MCPFLDNISRKSLFRRNMTNPMFFSTCDHIHNQPIPIHFHLFFFPANCLHMPPPDPHSQIIQLPRLMFSTHPSLASKHGCSQAFYDPFLNLCLCKSSLSLNANFAILTFDYRWLSIREIPPPLALQLSTIATQPLCIIIHASSPIHSPRLINLLICFSVFPWTRISIVLFLFLDCDFYFVFSSSTLSCSIDEEHL